VPDVDPHREQALFGAVEPVPRLARGRIRVCDRAVWSLIHQDLPDLFAGFFFGSFAGLAGFACLRGALPFFGLRFAVAVGFAGFASAAGAGLGAAPVWGRRIGAFQPGISLSSVMFICVSFLQG
jgi:hypothetical protein